MTRANPRYFAHDADILAGIPSGVWADLWATEQEERGRSFSGQNLIAAAPPPPRWARRWAKQLADSIVRANGDSLAALYAKAKAAGYPRSASHFGFHLGMQSAGHGVSYSDDCDLDDDAIEIPHNEFYRGVVR